MPMCYKLTCNFYKIEQFKFNIEQKDNITNNKPKGNPLSIVLN